MSGNLTNHGQKVHHGDTMNLIPILEKFVSLQGEGDSQGFPTTFIRVAGCNLRCSYCDTKHSWTIDGVPLESVEEILEWIKGQWPGIVCFTGGEPLLYDEILILINKLAFDGYDVVVETNGTIDIGKVKGKMLLESLPRISFVMDFKSENVEMTEEQRMTVYKNLGEISVYDEVKFVVPYSDLGWAIDTIDKYNIRNPIISPVITDCTTQTDLMQFADHFLGLACRYGLSKVKLQTQLHKQIWGNRRMK